MNIRNLFALLTQRVTPASTKWRGALAVLLFGVLSLAGVAGAEPRLTEKCNTSWGRTVNFWIPPGELLNTITDAVDRPESNPGLYEKLWRPEHILQKVYSWSDGMAVVMLTYPISLDMEEILASIKQEGILSVPEVKFLAASGNSICFAALPGLPTVTLTEFYNAALDHYALAVGPDEVAFVEGGHWGEGWVRSGETIAAKPADGCYDTHFVQRFASLRDQWPPSLFYTVKPEVCGFLRNHNAGWSYLAHTFGAHAPEDGVCKRYPQPVYQLYNNRPDINRVNHRYTTKLSIYNGMQTKGWVGEGIAFCV